MISNTYVQLESHPFAPCRTRYLAHRRSTPRHVHLPTGSGRTAAGPDRSSRRTRSASRFHGRDGQRAFACFSLEHTEHVTRDKTGIGTAWADDVGCSQRTLSTHAANALPGSSLSHSVSNGRRTRSDSNRRCNVFSCTRSPLPFPMSTRRRGIPTWRGLARCLSRSPPPTKPTLTISVIVPSLFISPMT